MAGLGRFEFPLSLQCNWNRLGHVVSRWETAWPPVSLSPYWSLDLMDSISARLISWQALPHPRVSLVFAAWALRGRNPRKDLVKLNLDPGFAFATNVLLPPWISVFSSVKQRWWWWWQQLKIDYLSQIIHVRKYVTRNFTVGPLLVTESLSTFLGPYCLGSDSSLYTCMTLSLSVLICEVVITRFTS